MVFYLKCVAQNYAWGKEGLKSKVAQLIHNFNENIYPVDEYKCYAELWMGTHPKGPSEILGHKQPNQPPVKVLLSEYIESSPLKILGSYVMKEFGGTSEDGQGSLPFLFKVLSINKALSIQAHPDKQLAIELHQKYPEHYPDDNHKPEIAIALTPFKALCGFRVMHEIVSNLKSNPELEQMIGSSICEALYQEVRAGVGTNGQGEKAKIALKNCFTAFMESPEDKIKLCIEQINQRYNKGEVSGDKIVYDLFLVLNSQFPYDIGCLSVFFLNIIDLEPGQAIFLGPNEPHAYIHGDCVECMACSDNVVRAGLTPKFKDTKVLCSMLTYSTAPPAQKILPALELSRFVSEFRPSVPEFAVQMIRVNKESLLNQTTSAIGNQNTTTLSLGPVGSASIMIVIEGLANYNLCEASVESAETTSSSQHDSVPVHRLRSGAVIFMNAHEPLSLLISFKEAEHFLAFRAYVPNPESRSAFASKNVVLP